MSVFETLTMWSYGSRADFLLPIINYLSLTILSRHVDKFVYNLTLLRYI